jgi:CheY-like chemotaxis protein
MTTILIVEDELCIADALGDLLRDEGYDVEVAYNGKEGLAAARQHPPDLVLSDVMMPVLDGLGLCSAMQGDAALQRIPFVLMSAAPQAVAQATCGYTKFLRKPFSLENLVEMVEALAPRTSTQASS